jgi:hypothetical protein
MRSFRDSANAEWTVFEVRRQRNTKADVSYLPSGYNDGWLCFERIGEKRRLVQYPEKWREFSDAELEKLLQKAQPAPRSAFRLGDDLGDGLPDLHAE